MDLYELQQKKSHKWLSFLTEANPSHDEEDVPVLVQLGDYMDIYVFYNGFMEKHRYNNGEIIDFLLCFYI